MFVGIVLVILEKGGVISLIFLDNGIMKVGLGIVLVGY